ncbi:MAG TPA: Crp/Fnr family transcriptional regulator [Stellaceae bacterium]
MLLDYSFGETVLYGSETDDLWCAGCPFGKLHSPAPFDPEQLVLLQYRPGELRSAPAETLLIREDEPESQVLVLVTGWAARSKLMPDGREIILQLHLPGDLIGYTPALIGEPPHFSLYALTPITYQLLDRKRVAAVFDTAPALARQLMLRLAHRQRIVEYWLMNLARRRVDQRLAWVLLVLFTHLRRLGLVKDGAFRFPLSQQQVADVVGAHVIHVNRVLGQFRQHGLVRMQNRQLHIDNLDGLRQAACACGTVASRD